MERRLTELRAWLSHGELLADGADVQIRQVRDNSAQVEPGDLFVAVRGEETDGHAYIRDAVARGAVAVIAEERVAPGVPVVVVPDSRTALTEIAAGLYGHPADHLQMVGITGTVGKTSILQMLNVILGAAGIGSGAIGSLGVEIAGRVDSTANTTPGALELQRALAEMVAAGARVAAMEVTSHALVQQRVRGVHYQLGIFTNLSLLEHLEYHGSFRAYVEAKSLFLQYLEPAAPLLVPSGDRAARELVRAHPGPVISCGGSAAWVSVRRDALDLDGSAFTLNIRRPLPRVGGGIIAPGVLALRTQSPGRTHIANGTLAAVAALCLGASREAIRAALAALPAPPRRLQVVRREGPIIIDDTVGHPDSITGVFEVAARVRHRRLLVVFAVRGRRGPLINARDAEALAIWHRRVPLHMLFVTSAEDSADERNRVEPAERAAFLDTLRQHDVPHRHMPTLRAAVTAAVTSAVPHDLILLLGAQGMDAGAALALQARDG